MAVYDPSVLTTPIPLNKPLWGFAYVVDNETGRNVLKSEPVCGEVAWTGMHVRQRHFFPYKKGTTERRKSGDVYYQSRWYADTEVEAKQAYNDLIDNRIKLLNKMAADAEKDKLK